MLRQLFFLSLIGGLLAVGCEESPCDHICVDTIDSYICYCFENWELQDDQHTCRHPRDTAFDNMALGCYTENDDTPDFEFFAWDRTLTGDATIENCVHACRTRAFTYAALRNGGECSCTNNHMRIYGNSSSCDMTCSGEDHQICGGADANSVFRATQDKRYMGCFTEDLLDLDLTVVMWDETEQASPQDCILACSDAGHLFAGVMNGGRCACGDTYGKHGNAHDSLCNVTCLHGWQEQNCGGVNENAVYRIVRASDDSIPYNKDTPVTRASVPARILTEYPHTSGILTKRFVLYASDQVMAPYEDYECYSSDCYATCGNIHRPEGIDSNKKDVIIRDFHLKLSEIPAMITAEAERVYVFAQTLVIDVTTSFNASIYLRARQIIINYEDNPEIVFDHNGAELNYDITAAVNRGPPSDLVFMKLSTLCARMLFYRETDLDLRLGWSIMDDIARDYSYGNEMKTYQDAVRNYKSAYSGLHAYGVKFAPYFTKSFLERQLENYYDKISIYRDEFEAMMDDITDCNNFLDRADTLIGIWADTIVAEADLLRQATYSALDESEAVYRRMFLEFNESRAELGEALELFIDGIIKAVVGKLLRGLLGLARSIIKMATGDPPTKSQQTADDLADAVPELESTVQGMPYAMENIAYGVMYQEDFLELTDQMMNGLLQEPPTLREDDVVDWSQFDGVAGIVSTLYVVIEEWQNIADIVDVTLRNPAIRDIDGALEFRMAFLDFCTWGEAFTRSIIEHGENMRRAISASAMYVNRKLMQTRYDLYFAQVELDCTQSERAAVRWAEQNYDVMIELNNVLITFCQAYYYEEMIQCPESAMPSFEDSLDDLLLRVLNAINVVGSMGRSSSAIIDVEITDTDTNSTCVDFDVCPVNVFRNTGSLTYKTPDDLPAFFEIDLLLVEEIRIKFHGAETTTPEDPTKQSLRVFIESSGPFFNRRDGRIDAFITKAMSQRTYQYNLITDVIELSCDLYEASGSKVQHLTPFTTWMVRLTDVPSMEHIDVSSVERITLTFLGSFLQGRRHTEPVQQHYVL